MSKSTLIISFALGVSAAYLADSVGKLAGIATVMAVQAQTKEKPFKLPAEANTEFHLPPQNLPTPKSVAVAKPTPAKPKVANCFKVDSMTNVSVPIEARFQVIAHSECPFETGLVYVPVKYFDKDGYRTGIAYWVTTHVAPGEKIRHTFAAMIAPELLHRIETVMVTEEPNVALEFGHGMLPSASDTAGYASPSLVIDNFSGTVRNFEKK